MAARQVVSVGRPLARWPPPRKSLAGHQTRARPTSLLVAPGGSWGKIGRRAIVVVVGSLGLAMASCQTDG